jgi:solute carrier family 9 (sodium/hydrogen exchanger), member 8
MTHVSYYFHWYVRSPRPCQLKIHTRQSREVFFFVLLPPVMFEAGYSLNRKDFCDNIGAITLHAMVGTIISTFVVGLLTFYMAKQGLIKDIDKENLMEALLFGVLISAVDPVATLSIMGNADLQVNPLLYSLVFGKSVLNDAIAMFFFKTFHRYYSPDGPDWQETEIPAALLLAFITVTILRIGVGVFLGLLTASFMYKHTQLSEYPKFETSLLFCFCYLCYSIAESVELSGIMAIFFQGLILSHYNSYNLSPAAHVASERIFSTLATITETAVFLYMGMGVFTGRFANWDILFSVLALSF